MPELPEVETTRRGVAPLLVGAVVTAVVLRAEKLRWPLDPRLDQLLCGRQLQGIRRRAKYLLFDFNHGCLLVHLGMSGSLRVISGPSSSGKHDHVDLVFEGDRTLRLTDPRKFGAMLWVDGDPLQHRLLAALGPEPLGQDFSPDYLFRSSRRRKIVVKSFLMNQKVVVGVGNIYASEALFRAGISPVRPAGSVTCQEYEALVEAVRQVLKESIASGGTTLQDFQQSDGRPGYFKQDLKVYGREGEACSVCANPIKKITLAQRSTYFCASCQV